MIQIFPDATLVPSLLRLVGANLYYWPFISPTSLSLANVLADFSLSTSTGFTVPVANFTLTGVSAHVGKITAPDQAIVNSSGSSADMYGYFVTDAIAGGSPSGNLVMCALFDGAPITLPNGGTYNVTPTLALQQLS